MWERHKNLLWFQGSLDVTKFSHELLGSKTSWLCLKPEFLGRERFIRWNKAEIIANQLSNCYTKPDLLIYNPVLTMQQLRFSFLTWRLDKDWQSSTRLERVCGCSRARSMHIVKASSCLRSAECDSLDYLISFKLLLCNLIPIVLVWVLLMSSLAYCHFFPATPYAKVSPLQCISWKCSVIFFLISPWPLL